MTIEWEPAVRDVGRLAALERSALAEVVREDVFDRLLELAVAVTGAPRGVITFVNAERTTAISGVGFPEGILSSTPPLSTRSAGSSWLPGNRSLSRTPTMIPAPSAIPPSMPSWPVSWMGYAIEDDEGFILGKFCADGRRTSRVVSHRHFGRRHPGESGDLRAGASPGAGRGCAATTRCRHHR